MHSLIVHRKASQAVSPVPGAWWAACAGMTAFLFLVSFAWASGRGTQGAAFLDIPVGAGPAALGGAYSALARDAYAPTWNPAGLGDVQGVQFSGQHLDYLESLHY